MLQIHAVDFNCSDDLFDRLPDSLVLVILNKVADVRSLGRCRAVSKRFSALVPHVQRLFLKIDRVVSGDESPASSSDASPKQPGFLCNVLNYVIFSVIRPILHLRGRSLLPPLCHRSPAQVLKNFPHVRDLRIELPASDIATEDGVLLKWRAEFGSTLHSCVILGGTRLDRHVGGDVADEGAGAGAGGIPEAFYTDGGLKLRVVWTISSLIAASTRHFLLRQIVKDHPTLKSLVLTDVDGQGTLTMGEEQLREFRETPAAAAAAAQRTQVPASLLKLRYASRLLLPDGGSIHGATLVAIRPSPEAAAGRKDGDALAHGFFEEPFATAARALFHRRIYLLEMNSF
ncbi:F-box protein At4g18380-like [Wolffia australiana]